MYIYSLRMNSKVEYGQIGNDQQQNIYIPDSVLCSLFANFFNKKMSSVISVLPNINSVRLNLNLTSTQNHWSYFSLPKHDIVSLC